MWTCSPEQALRWNYPNLRQLILRAESAGDWKSEENAASEVGAQCAQPSLPSAPISLRLNASSFHGTMHVRVTKVR